MAGLLAGQYLRVKRPNDPQYDYNQDHGNRGVYAFTH